MISKLIIDLKLDPEKVYNPALERQFGVGTQVDREVIQASLTRKDASGLMSSTDNKKLFEKETAFCYIRPDIRWHLYGRHI